MQKKFTIVFKSGAKVEMTAEHIKTTYNTITSALTELKYTDATANIPIYLNMNELAGIFQNNIPDIEEEDHGNV